ncbi:MAG: hypothetical protein EB060_07090 [Proteobacteria bacterium]|nr:hypothetical protein [Pseudomonadota bacterium]
MRMFVRTWMLVIVLLGTSACEQMYSQLTMPRPWGLTEVPDGPPEFQQGWRDGCDTGIGAYGDSWYKMYHTFKQDANLVKNPSYYRAWKDAYTHCRWYTEQWTRPWY